VFVALALCHFSASLLPRYVRLSSFGILYTTCRPVPTGSMGYLARQAGRANIWFTPAPIPAEPGSNEHCKSVCDLRFEDLWYRFTCSHRPGMDPTKTSVEVQSFKRLRRDPRTNFCTISALSRSHAVSTSTTNVHYINCEDDNQSNQLWRRCHLDEFLVILISESYTLQNSRYLYNHRHC
jgi:hypothetical protein